MQRVALIHTVPTVYATFAGRILDVIPEIKITNIVDEFLASDPAEKGVFTAINKSRLFAIVKCAESTGADAIVTTCSTLSPIIEDLQAFVDVPIVTIDGAMLKRTVADGNTIAVVATADSTLGPTVSKLRAEAVLSGKSITVSQILCSEAYAAIKARDQKTHDREVLGRIRDMPDHDVVVLAQASMAHLERPVADITGSVVLSSPRLCIDELKSVLKGQEGRAAEPSAGFPPRSEKRA